MSGDLPAAYSSASTSKNRREDEEDGRSSSGEVTVVLAECLHGLFRFPPSYERPNETRRPQSPVVSGEEVGKNAEEVEEI